MTLSGVQGAQTISSASDPAPMRAAAEPVAREFREADAAKWTEFVTAHLAANLYHTLFWRDLVIEVFGHRPIYLLAERGGKICGALPMFFIKAPLLGSKLISMPYDIGSGGALTVDGGANDVGAVERALVESATSLARELKVNHLELRYGSERPALADLGFQRGEPVLISEMDLDDEAAVWARIKEDHRKAIGKAERRGVTVREAESLADYRAFYEIYLRVFRDFGTPPYGADYFPALWRRLHPSGKAGEAGAARLLLAEAGGRCVGGLLLFCWGRNLVSKFAACLPEAAPLRAYVALYWRAIQLGLRLGYRRLSWGTSSRGQKGLIEFKERWGARSRPAVIYSLPVKRGVPAIEKYYDTEGLTRRLWRALPLDATRAGGGIINRWFC
ncbi:MAG: lipid II:glycine glycyltransferase FemX [Blastocatellia bacterium]